MSCTLALNFRFNQLPSPTKMPHIVIEYTPNLTNLPFNAMLDAVTRRLAESTEVQDEADLKARVVCADHFRVGQENSGRGFIHVTIRIMAGRKPSKTSANVLPTACWNTCPSLGKK